MRFVRKIHVVTKTIRIVRQGVLMLTETNSCFRNIMWNIVAVNTITFVCFRIVC